MGDAQKHNTRIFEFNVSDPKLLTNLAYSSRTGEYWPSVVCTDFAMMLGPYCHDLGPIFPSTAEYWPEYWSETPTAFLQCFTVFHKMGRTCLTHEQDFSKTTYPAVRSSSLFSQKSFHLNLLRCRCRNTKRFWPQ